MSNALMSNYRGVDTCSSQEEIQIINMSDKLFHGLGRRNNLGNNEYFIGAVTKVENGFANNFDSQVLYPYSILVLEHILKSGCIRPMAVSEALGCHFNFPTDVNDSSNVASQYVSLSKTGIFHSSFLRYIAHNPALIINKKDLMESAGKLINEPSFKALGIHDSVQGEYLYDQPIPIESVLGIALPYPISSEDAIDTKRFIEMIKALLAHYNVNIPIVDCDGKSYTLK